MCFKCRDGGHVNLKQPAALQKLLAEPERSCAAVPASALVAPCQCAHRLKLCHKAHGGDFEHLQWTRLFSKGQFNAYNVLLSRMPFFRSLNTCAHLVETPVQCYCIRFFSPLDGMTSQFH
jgi:hypothetical protein